ncbi:MAG: hypothetical protein M5U01_10275 [Ardenticatenaceae bacterium]|nr:hypothetical protein [Ardenticatenaceae bacterium]
MQPLAIIFTLAVVVEALVEYFGTPVPSEYKPYLAAVVGVGLCVAYDADLLALLGFAATVPYLGSILTGLLIARGSNYLNDLVGRLSPGSVEGSPDGGHPGREVLSGGTL